MSISAHWKIALYTLLFLLARSVAVLADGLIEWEQVNGPLGAPIQTLAVLPYHPETILAGTLNGVYRSTDGGRSWAQIAADRLACQEINALAVEPHPEGAVYVGGNGGMFRGLADGSDWVRLGSGLNGDLVLALAIDP
ncbi:MAG: hypothetical protein H5T69_18105, partial [Chloroflexi bacterium]|nr:hypothetical protein [Chloroflexota bacterium]